MSKTSIAGKITSDAALGAFGCSLAVAAATFGIYMTIHGPVASLGTSKDFSVFAQLAPMRTDRARRAPATGRDDLDMTTTASIAPQATASEVAPRISLRSAEAGRATILVDGELRSVRVGDLIPGAGEVLAINAGAEPSVRTATGLIVSAQR